MEQTKAIPPIFALCGFAVSAISGALSGSGTSHGLSTALLAMVICGVVGMLCAWVVRFALDAHIKDKQTRASTAATSNPNESAPPPAV